MEINVIVGIVKYTTSGEVADLKCFPTYILIGAGFFTPCVVQYILLQFLLDSFIFYFFLRDNP